MVRVIADNIISPLGMSTEQNYLAVKAGQSALRHYEQHWGLPDAFTASLFTDEQNAAMHLDGFTRFEALVMRCVQPLLAAADIEVASDRVVFILATTKANIEQLQRGNEPTADIVPGEAAQKIARALGFTTMPIVVCNACISGVAAVVLAQQLLEAGTYDTAVVCGTDVQDKFTVSGFQSLKAVAEDACRPFDIERLGLNLGEGAAAMVLQREGVSANKEASCCIEAGAVRNDAFHLSSPSKTGEGARLALQAIHATELASELAFINAHGTATMFNDQMESIAIERAGLQGVPVNALKGTFGHTMGAAGILETVISIAALRAHTILGSRGFEELGVSGHIRLSNRHEDTDKRRFVKMISGFGGGNAAISVSLPATLNHKPSALNPQPSTVIHQPSTLSHHIKVTEVGICLDGQTLPLQSRGRELLVEAYKTFIGDYPKFYKMDGLSRLGFVAAELLLQAERGERLTGTPEARNNRAIILFNNTSSIMADRHYWATVSNLEASFPSPAHFVYTLPNIVAGELAIRHQYRGETSFYILPKRDEALMAQVVNAAMADGSASSALTGWIDYPCDEHFEAELWIIEN